MNTNEIDRILHKTPGYRGTFSCDTLPGLTGLVVANTDPHNRPGEHWIAIYISADRRHGEYFDSFGRRPTRVFEQYLNDNCLNWTYNTRQLQSIASRFCGFYCVYYCLLRSRNVSMQKIISNFTTDTGFNDVLIHRFICR
jgi:hypothetical protein